MRIAYCTNIRLPSERAHGHQVAQVCEALMRMGNDVTIFAPFRRNVVEKDYWQYYEADRRVKLTYVGSFDAIASPFTPGIIGLLTMNMMLRRGFRKIFKKCHSEPCRPIDLLYTRTPALLSVLLATGIPVVLELHQLPRFARRSFVRRCLQCRLVVCLTSPMRDRLLQWGVPAERVVVEGDAVDLRRFVDPPLRANAHGKFGLKTDRLVVGYVGRLKTLGMDKGVAVLLQALQKLQRHRQFFGFIVGGPKNDEEEYARMADALGLTAQDVAFAGEVPASLVPLSLAGCDILAMPFPDFPHYRHNMSPLKMFEYMAAGKPIVTCDLPTVRDVLSEETAIFCKPGDVESLAQALLWVRGHSDEAASRARAAKELVKEHTWEKRMERILSAARLSS